jgi:putative membrane protein
VDTALMSPSAVLAADAADAWRWQAHLEVWVLVIGVLALAVYAVRVVGPKVVPAGRPIVTRRQQGFFWSGLALLWLASDWPIHDISEEYLFSVHMVQHLLLSLVVPPLFLLATPTWLARLIVPEGSAADRWVGRLTRPLVAGLLFNLVVAVTHIPGVVNASIGSGPLHYGIHVVVVTSAFIMWTPVCGPFPERRMAMPAQMVYLFLMSVLPTIPAAWLTFAEGAVYKAYDQPFRLWGVSLASDQQAAGLIMKLVGGFYLWGIIFTIFVRWAKRHAEADAAGITVTEKEVLTWPDVEDEFRRHPPRSETTGAGRRS